MICPNCKEVYSSKVCPRCGYDQHEEEIKEDTKTQKNEDSGNELIYWLLSGIMIIVIVIFFEKIGVGISGFFKTVFGTLKSFISVD